MPSSVAGSEIQHARVVMHDGTWVAVDELINQGDSLWGLIPHSAHAGSPLARFAADTSQIAQVLVKHIDFARVGAIFVTPVVLVGSSYFLLDF